LIYIQEISMDRRTTRSCERRVGLYIDHPESLTADNSTGDTGLPDRQPHVLWSHFHWPPAQAVLENASENMYRPACIVCLCTSDVLPSPSLATIYTQQLSLRRQAEKFAHTGATSPCSRGSVNLETVSCVCLYKQFQKLTNIAW
jgi:hypothetical protein